MLRNHNEIAKDLESFGCFDKPTSETHCVAFGEAKKAALLFDRVYFDSYDYFTHLSFVDWSPNQKWADESIEFSSSNILPYSQLPHPSIAYLDQEISLTLTRSLPPVSFTNPIPASEYFRIYRELILSLFNDGKLSAVPFVDEFDQSKSGSNGITDQEAWAIIFNNIHTPEIYDTPWDQILDFRKDSISVNDYRKIRNLHRKLLACTSVTQASDEVGLQIERYELAMKKHGFNLVNSSLKLIYSKESAIAAGIAAAVTGSVTAAIIASGLSIGSQLIMNIAQQSINKKEWMISENSEAGIIVKSNKKFGDQP